MGVNWNIKVKGNTKITARDARRCRVNTFRKNEFVETIRHMFSTGSNLLLV